MKSREVVKREVTTKEKIRLLISSTVLLSLLINGFVSPDRPNKSQPPSPISTPNVTGPTLSK
jgi:hypothetical protein